MHLLTVTHVSQQLHWFLDYCVHYPITERISQMWYSQFSCISSLFSTMVRKSRLLHAFLNILLHFLIYFCLLWLAIDHRLRACFKRQTLHTSNIIKTKENEVKFLIIFCDRCIVICKPRRLKRDHSIETYTSLTPLCKLGAVYLIRLLAAASHLCPPIARKKQLTGCYFANYIRNKI